MAERKLAKYNQKRDFKKTAEPSGKEARSKSGFSYLVQKHAATRLHYDFRLELNGVLKSWAVTRGPSLDPQDKRLAVEVEDHPVAYGGFEGIIPKGEYGGGTVMMWDEGTWEPTEDPVKGLKNGSLKFRLHGKRLRGEWALVRMKPRPQDRGRSNWLLIKHNDRYAKPGQGEKYLEKNNTSIISKRKMEAIAADADRQWKSKPNIHSTAGTSPPIGKVAKKKSVKSRMPGFIKPQLATLTDTMPQGKDWLHEVKFDGYRVLAYVNGGHVTMYTRNGNNWTEKFGAVPQALSKLKVDNAILDGELVALSDNKITSFSALKNSLSKKGANLSYYVFDLLHLNGKSLLKEPLIERKKQLEELFKKQKFDTIFYSEHFQQQGDFMGKACAMGLEGIISKRADAPYHIGRGKGWLKTKCHKRQEFVIGGYTNSTTGNKVVGSLLLGYYEGKDFVYAGRVGTGFDQKMARQLYTMLRAIERSTMAYTQYSDGGRRGPSWKRGVHWVEPDYVCEVEFTEWTEDGALRHPSFQGLREDKPARTITREKAVKLSTARKAAAKEVSADKRKPATKSGKKDGHDVMLSHPEKILFPTQGYTKQDLADYYDTVAEWIMPHVAERPLSFVRCPQGSKKPCFFQRHSGLGQSEHIIKLPIYKKEEPYLMIKDAEGLRAMVQMGVLEIHQWGSHAKTWNKPDLLVFDFDPDEKLSFERVKEAALEIKKRLAKLKLKSFLKTTGGKGLHVCVPIKPQHDWDTIKQFCRALAETMAEDFPQKYTTNIRKEQRKGRIFVDYLRNGETATAIAPYSSRARDGAPVSVPLSWSELPALKSGNSWTIKTLPARLRKMKKDPWAEYFTTKQSLKLPK